MFINLDFSKCVRGHVRLWTFLGCHCFLFWWREDPEDTTYVFNFYFAKKSMSILNFHKVFNNDIVIIFLYLLIFITVLSLIFNH